jgi:hypothetical protein
MKSDVGEADEAAARAAFFFRWRLEVLWTTSAAGEAKLSSHTEQWFFFAFLAVLAHLRAASVPALIGESTPAITAS